MVPDYESLLKFYARKDIQETILAHSKGREVGTRYGSGNFGKRPDILQFNSDIFELARQGVTSFHISEERWSNPLELHTGMTKKELDELRAGWDCVLDIDSSYVEYSQITAYLLCEAIKFYGIKSYSIKFSGRKGFHIIIPFESFPEEVAGTSIKDLFPEGPKMIAEFLGNMIFDKLSEKILSEQSLNEIIKSTGKKEKELKTEDGRFNPFSIVDIDTILISSRHLFRSPYSINEKSWLVSTPIEPSQIMKFKLSQAKIDKVTTDIPFLKKAQPEESRQLLMQAFDKSQKPRFALQRSTIIVEGKDYFEQASSGIKKDYFHEEIDNSLVKEEYFPPCIQELLNGRKDDGRKRALFVLMNFLNGLNYPLNKIRTMLLEWNKKNYEALQEGYIAAQLSSMARNPKKLLPPNCDNDSYYKNLGVACNPDMHCQRLKNPLNFTLSKIRLEQKNKKNIRKKTSSKK